jgi:hypothetical protein
MPGLESCEVRHRGMTVLLWVILGQRRDFADKA